MPALGAAGYTWEGPPTRLWYMRGGSNTKKHTHNSFNSTKQLGTRSWEPQTPARPYHTHTKLISTLHRSIGSLKREQCLIRNPGMSAAVRVRRGFDRTSLVSPPRNFVVDQVWERTLGTYCPEAGLYRDLAGISSAMATMPRGAAADSNVLDASCAAF